MPRQKNWRKGFARKKSLHGNNSVSMTRVAPLGRPKTANLCLFEDLARTEKRLQYIQARNERQHCSDEDSTDNQPEISKIKIAELKQEKQQMKEEIALLKLKIDVLLNMLAQATALTTIQNDELKQLRAQMGDS